MNEYKGEQIDIMIALNAYRSALSILKFNTEHPKKPLVVALTGTDLYKFMDSHRDVVIASIEAADRLVVLSDLAHLSIPLAHSHKAYLIYESAEPLPNGRKPLTRYFDICVIGHLRPEKDSMLSAIAARKLPESSRIRIRHYGKAHTKEWAKKASDEMLQNKRYTWFGEVPHWKIRQVLSKCRLLVQSSKMEGGPNILSEAVVAGVPILSTDIDGCRGVLGKNYKGYFSVGDSDSLQELMLRAETYSNFLTDLEHFVIEIASRFSHQEEEARWAGLITELFQENVKGYKYGQ
jgi:putative glycosyltransferase (TIGR04348 family)